MGGNSRRDWKLKKPLDLISSARKKDKLLSNPDVNCVPAKYFWKWMVTGSFYIHANLSRRYYKLMFTTFFLTFNLLQSFKFVIEMAFVSCIFNLIGFFAIWVHLFFVKFLMCPPFFSIPLESQVLLFCLYLLSLQWFVMLCI